jgi:glycosyltransferase involved in cell wall biosynthesis
MGTLVMMHFPTNTGFALGALETIFYRTALAVENGDASRVHFSFENLSGGQPDSLPDGFDNLLAYDFRSGEPAERERLSAYLAANPIDRVLAFDLTPGDPSHAVLRAGGVRRILSYLGAPMGSIRSGPSLWIRKLRTALQSRADLYVFESDAMRDTGVRGRGLAAAATALVRTGLDLDRFRPDAADATVIRERLGIPNDRAVVFYAGHMEPRKGVAVIVRAAIQLVDEEGYERAHFLLCGNRPGEADPFDAMLEGTRAREFVTFAGYRDDLAEIMAGAAAGVIASTGWDSFPRSAMEMSASGLPLIASALQGLNETVVHGSTGYLFPPGDHHALATHIRELIDDEEHRSALATASRELAEARYSEARQVDELAALLRD